MSDVFVSYKAEDRRRVRPLVQALEADGYSVWWDEHIGTGDEWRQAIESQLDAARCVIVVWSKASIGPKGQFVRDEAVRAQRRQAYVPVLIDAVEPPLGFGESQATSLKGWKGDRSDRRYHAVLEAVSRIAGHGQPAMLTTAPALVSRRAALAGGAVVAVIAGIGGWVLLKPGSASDSDSIAVIPFANLSSDPNEAYFADGIAEELRTALTRLARLKVVARTSSEKVREEDVKVAARKLGVANVLTGSVRRSSSTIRVNAQLIDGRTGLERWSDVYDRDPGDALAIQTDIAVNVARALSIALGSAAQAKIALGGTRNAAARDQFLKAVALGRSSDSEDVQRHALQLIDNAIHFDSNYADAFAQKSIILRNLSEHFARSPQELARGMDEAASSAQQAVAIAPDLPAGHVALANVRAAQLNLRGALAEFRNARALSPNDPQLLLDYGLFLAELGRIDDALKLVQESIALDPLNPDAFFKRTVILFIGTRFSQSALAARQTLELSPAHAGARGILGDSYQALGKLGDAQEQYSLMPPDNRFRLASESILAARKGDRQKSDQLLKRLSELYSDSAGWQIAVVHAQRGEIDQALDYIENGFAARDPGIGWIRVDPWLAPLRNESRFQAIIRKLDFPD